MIRTQQQILTEFGLRMSTFAYLVTDKQIDRDRFESKNGRRIIDLTDKDVFILKCARNSIYNFGTGSVSHGRIRGVHAFPFHRYLILKFITDSLEEAYEEIFQFRLLPSKKLYPISNLKRIYDRFLSFCPEVALKYIETKEPPTDAVEKDLFETFLRAINISDCYNDPGIIQQLFELEPYKQRFELFLTTDDKDRIVAECASRAFHLTLGQSAVVFYRRFFYALHDLTDEDRLAYFSLLPPTDRELRTSALGRTIADLSLERGMAEASEEMDLIRALKTKAMMNFSSVKDLRIPQGLQIGKAFLDQYSKLQSMVEGGEKISSSKLSAATDIIVFESESHTETGLIAKKRKDQELGTA